MFLDILCSLNCRIWWYETKLHSTNRSANIRVCVQAKSLITHMSSLPPQSQLHAGIVPPNPNFPLHLGLKPGTFRNHQPLLLSQKYCRYNWMRTAVQMGGVPQYQWEVYCGVCLCWWLRSQAQRYKWGVYCCGTNWRCIAELSRRVVWVGGS